MNRHWSVSTHLVTDQKTKIIQLRRNRLSTRRILLRNDRSILLNKKNHSTERIERSNSFDLDINQFISLLRSSSENQLIVTIHKRRLNFFEANKLFIFFSHNQLFSQSNFLAKFLSWLLSRWQAKYQSTLISLILKTILILTSLAKSIKTTSFRKQ